MYGTYNRLGYEIFTDDDDEPVYTAGNCPGDSQTYLDATDPHALPLDIIQRYCISTGQEMSQEQLLCSQCGEPMELVRRVVVMEAWRAR
jgi:hypothetical protein